MRKIKRFSRWLVKNWIWIAAGCVFQKKTIDAAFASRGHFAIGGEYLVLPAFILLALVISAVREAVREYMDLEEQNG